MKTYDNINVKRATLEVIESIYRDLDDKVQNVKQEYRKVGVDETKQRTSWKTGELLWEDAEQTIPSYEPIYDFVDKEELNDTDLAMLDAIAIIRKALDKLV